jgi:hypothetical protein
MVQPLAFLFAVMTPPTQNVGDGDERNGHGAGGGGAGAFGDEITSDETAPVSTPSEDAALHAGRTTPRARRAERRRVFMEGTSRGKSGDSGAAHMRGELAGASAFRVGIVWP